MNPLPSRRTVEAKVYFLFQAEGGIRDLTVTGVQTCALPICEQPHVALGLVVRHPGVGKDAHERLIAHALADVQDPRVADRKSTRLNSSHSQISYAVFCLKKKKHAELRHNLCVPLVTPSRRYPLNLH